MSAQRTKSPRKAKAGLSSIIIPCWNQLEFTRICLESLFERTGPAWELIVIDNGSADGTAAYLAGLGDTCSMPVTVITNQENRGFPAAVNQGLQAAKGDYLVLLNNDAVVTDGWLDGLIALTKIAPDVAGSPVGMVGAMSNYVTPPQVVEPVPYRDLEAMHGFAREWKELHRGRWLPANKLSGFCLLMTRAVHEAVGGLDERFGLGFFDDDDLGLRVRKAGFRLLVAQDVFVHHFGNRTMIGNGVDAEALINRNQAIFLAKWGDEVQVIRNKHAITGRDTMAKHNSTTAGGDSDGSGDHSRKAKVSLTMIVRDEERNGNLLRCLESVRGLFDEIVVVDTGSTDRTKEIAAGFGARVVDFAWIDDFAAARNVALDHATGDYVFSLDADDVIEPLQQEKLATLLKQLRPDGREAYVLRCVCDTSDGTPLVVDQPRLFPRRDDIRWERRIHEVINTALHRAGIAMRWTDIIVRHGGYVDSVIHEQKRQRNLILLHQELAERPNDPFIYYYLGTTAFERKEWQEALGYFLISQAKCGTKDAIGCKLFGMLAWTYEILTRYDESLFLCDVGLRSFPNDGELWFRKAVALRQLHLPLEAEACWKRVLELGRPQTFYSVDAGIYGHLTRHNLALIAEERDDQAAADVHWRAILAECPGHEEALRRVVLTAA